ncbi:actin cortical patch SUR7/pH-response regulator pali [Aspergillus avenaceus]|uniref:Actin cortical patch SUR7/pH-response regulator pali n=1 Tax=Aspergillus avenaceus TaxID=36643 RepID=A0A5N6TMF6_ASPAV|nr:actin cortical patch SUR7/pH-response regulator pali [Aspergillus avenaceus]
MFLTLLGGARNTVPLNEIYFLQASTGDIPGAPTTSRWTFWNLCPVGDDGKSDCGKSHPDFPFDPPSHRNFDTTTNIPEAFIGTKHYFLTSRFMFPFLIIALFFGVVSLFTGFLAMCTRVGSYLSSLMAWIALIFQIITTCLMTAVFVQGRNRFNANGQHATLGAKSFGFMWTSVACLFLSCILYCLGGSVGSKESGYSGREHRRRGFFSSQRSNSVRSNKEANP